MFSELTKLNYVQLLKTIDDNITRWKSLQGELPLLKWWSYQKSITPSCDTLKLSLISGVGGGCDPLPPFIHTVHVKPLTYMWPGHKRKPDTEKYFSWVLLFPTVLIQNTALILSFWGEYEKHSNKNKKPKFSFPSQQSWFCELSLNTDKQQ